MLCKFDNRMNDAIVHFYHMRKQLLLSARLSHCNSVHPSLCHTGGSVKNGASQDRQIFTICCLEDSSFRNHKAFT